MCGYGRLYTVELSPKTHLSSTIFPPKSFFSHVDTKSMSFACIVCSVHTLSSYHISWYSVSIYCSLIIIYCSVGNAMGMARTDFLVAARDQQCHLALAFRRQNNFVLPSQIRSCEWWEKWKIRISEIFHTKQLASAVLTHTLVCMFKSIEIHFRLLDSCIFATKKNREKRNTRRNKRTPETWHFTKKVLSVCTQNLFSISEAQAESIKCLC